MMKLRVIVLLHARDRMKIWVRLRFQSGSLSVRGKSQGVIRIRVMLRIKKVTKSEGQLQGESNTRVRSGC